MTSPLLKILSSLFLFLPPPLLLLFSKFNVIEQIYSCIVPVSTITNVSSPLQETFTYTCISIFRLTRPFPRRGWSRLEDEPGLERILELGRRLSRYAYATGKAGGCVTTLQEIPPTESNRNTFDRLHRPLFIPSVTRWPESVMRVSAPSHVSQFLSRVYADYHLCKHPGYHSDFFCFDSREREGERERMNFFRSSLDLITRETRFDTSSLLWNDWNEKE